MNTREVGTAYEELACRTLEEEGLKILVRNYRVKIGEIDIIAADGEELVFVEVKYRRTEKQGGAEFAISAKKQQKIRKVAAWYLAANRLPQDTFCRFDAVLIDGERVQHLKNAW